MTGKTKTQIFKYAKKKRFTFIKLDILIASGKADAISGSILPLRFCLIFAQEGG